MGIVWLAHDDSLSEPVAFKFLDEIVASDEASIFDLKREVRRSRQLTHAHIIRVHDLVEDPILGVTGITMEVAGGGTLSRRRTQTARGWFEPEEIADWVRHLAAALDYAHQHARVVHRDLKPANLLLDSEGRLKIADFGIAAALQESATRLTQGRISGTPNYMSPEQWQGLAPSPADDLYALGATLYDLLTGKPPFFSGNIMAAASNLTPPSMAQRRRDLESIDAPLPPEWEAVVAALLAKRSVDRPPSAGEAIAALGLSPLRPTPLGPVRAPSGRTSVPPPIPSSVALTSGQSAYTPTERVVTPTPGITPTPALIGSALPAAPVPRTRPWLWLLAGFFLALVLSTVGFIVLALTAADSAPSPTPAPVAKTAPLSVEPSSPIAPAAERPVAVRTPLPVTAGSPDESMRNKFGSAVHGTMEATPLPRSLKAPASGR